MKPKLELIEQCITPDTLLTVSVLCEERYLHKLPNREIISYFHKHNDEGVTIEGTPVACYCAVGKILSCSGIPDDELQQAASNALSVWNNYADILKRFGFESYEDVFAVMDQNDDGEPNVYPEDMRRRAQRMLMVLKHFAE